ncbi:hypothetical protein [Delftia acidovorans]
MYEFFRQGVRLELRPLKGKHVACLYQRATSGQRSFVIRMDELLGCGRCDPATKRARKRRSCGPWKKNADAVVACLGKGFEREGGKSSQARRNPLLASMQTFSEGKLYVV